MPSNKIKEKGQRGLTIFAYCITVLFILVSFVPFVWMLSSSMKNSGSVYQFPPSWIPAKPQTVTVNLDYTALGQLTEEQAELEAMKATWFTWKKFQLEDIGQINVNGMRNGAVIYQAETKSYQFNSAKAIVVPSQMFTDNLIKVKMPLIQEKSLTSFEWYGVSGNGGVAVTAASEATTELGTLGTLGTKMQSYLQNDATFLEGEVSAVTQKGDWSRILDNYYALWLMQGVGGGLGFHHFIGNSLFVTIVSVLLQLIVGGMAGYALSRLVNNVWAGILTIFFVATIMIPEVAILVPLFLIIEKLNLVNSLWGIILPHAAWGIVIYLFKGFFDQLPGELLQAARIDGAGEMKVFSRIIVPMSYPIFTVVGVMTFIAVWNEFLWPLVVARKEVVWTFTVALNDFQSTKDANMVMATLVISTIPLLLLFVFCQKLIEKGTSWTGVKG